MPISTRRAASWARSRRHLCRSLGTKIGNDLRRFKQLVELGEIVHSDDSIIPGPNPAQPTREIPRCEHAGERHLRAQSNVAKTVTGRAPGGPAGCLGTEDRYIARRTR